MYRYSEEYIDDDQVPYNVLFHIGVAVDGQCSPKSEVLMVPTFWFTIDQMRSPHAPPPRAWQCRLYLSV